MKSAFYLLGAILAATNLGADPSRYPSRSIGLVNVELEPLFAWWTFASQTTNQPLDITEMDTNKLMAVSNLWLRLPARPLLAWFHVKASEDHILVVGSLWKIDATIEPAPMMFRRQTIYLRNPPVKEIQDFKLARAAFAALKNAQGKEVAAEQLWENNIQAEATTVLQTNSAPPILPNNRAALAQVQNLRQDLVVTDSNLNSAHARTQARDRQLVNAETFLAAFPDKQVYWVNHFALRTGETIDGIEVYDMGTASGPTY